MKITFPIAAVAALSLAACGSADNANAPDPLATDAGMPADFETDAAADTALPTDAQGFVNAASASDLYEIEAGKLAQASGKSQAVKDFGKMMETDHTKSSAELKTAAEAGGVTVNPQLTAKQQADLDALKAAGDNFDSVYKAQQLAAHQQALSLLRSYASTGDQQALKDFAAKTAPVVETHLGHAEMLP